MKDKKWNLFAVCLIICVGILSLRLVAEYPAGLVYFAKSLMGMMENVIAVFGLSSAAEALKGIPLKVLFVVVGVIEVIVGFLFFLLFKRPFEQGAQILLNTPFQVIRYGLAIYLLGIGVIVVFIYSVVGVPVAAGALIIMRVLSWIGNISLAIFFGYSIKQWLNIKGNRYLYYFLGSFIMAICATVYAFSAAFILFIFPVLSLGILFVLFLNKHIFQISMDTDFSATDKKDFDRRKMRDIITKDIE